MSYRVITGYLETQDKKKYSLKNKSLGNHGVLFGDGEDGGKVKEASAPSLIRCL